MMVTEPIKESVRAELFALRDQVAGITDSAVASVDGLLIVSDTDGVRPDVLAAMSAAALGLGRSTAAEMGMGELREVVTRCQSGHIAIYAIHGKSLLVVLGDEGLDVAHLHLQSRPAVSRLADLLG
jgi:predicted regulator of Ras-like GTPase activity (Roadblock/LC7/MglB family)